MREIVAVFTKVRINGKSSILVCPIKDVCPIFCVVKKVEAFERIWVSIWTR